VIGVGLLVIIPTIFAPVGGHSPLALSINNAKQVKLALESFAMDNDGPYPCAETAGFYECPADGSSNALFRQLFASKNTSSERIFWIRGAEICSKSSPDDVTGHGDKFELQETLQAGDNGWSYYEGFKNIAHPDHPLILGPILPGDEGYQWDLYDGRIVVLRIDSSARAMRIKTDGRIPDQEGRDILTGIDPGPDYNPVLRHPKPLLPRP
jgi:hypothetical protein